MSVRSFISLLIHTLAFRPLARAAFRAVFLGDSPEHYYPIPGNKRRKIFIHHDHHGNLFYFLDLLGVIVHAPTSNLAKTL